MVGVAGRDGTRDLREAWNRFRATRGRPLESVAVAEVMSMPVRTVHCTDTLWQALTVFVTEELRHLVVVDERDRYAGTVSDRGVALAWPADPVALRLRPVRDVVDACESVTPDCAVDRAAQVMWWRRLEALPVVDGDGTVHGIVTDTDLAGLVAARGTGGELHGL
ncbi:HPP family protein [Peterkaempfera sp. SMS 1(5)a]|uniref:CBS domain-containing protein n=1 Tax=Peterkaempfera podocarpi TaxID=3232308 RepID=UPI00366FE9BA